MPLNTVISPVRVSSGATGDITKGLGSILSFVPGGSIVSGAINVIASLFPKQVPEDQKNAWWLSVFQYALLNPKLSGTEIIKHFKDSIPYKTKGTKMDIETKISGTWEKAVRVLYDAVASRGLIDTSVPVQKYIDAAKAGAASATQTVMSPDGTTTTTTITQEKTDGNKKLLIAGMVLSAIGVLAGLISLARPKKRRR